MITEEQLNLAWQYSYKPTIMFEGDSAGLRASYKAAIMCLPFFLLLLLCASHCYDSYYCYDVYSYYSYYGYYRPYSSYYC